MVVPSEVDSQPSIEVGIHDLLNYVEARVLLGFVGVDEDGCFSQEAFDFRPRIAVIWMLKNLFGVPIAEDVSSHSALPKGSRIMRSRFYSEVALFAWRFQWVRRVTYSM